MIPSKWVMSLYIMFCYEADFKYLIFKIKYMTLNLQGFPLKILVIQVNTSSVC